MSDRHFGISTRLFQHSRLTPEHLTAIARTGASVVEVYATRSHFDYADPSAVANLARWTRDARLALHALHAPVADAIRGATWVEAHSIAAADEPRRKAAVAQVKAVLAVARTVPFRFLVLHLGIPAARDAQPGDNQAGAGRRSLREIATLAQEVGVTVALEVLPNALSTPDALVHLLESEDGLGTTGVCLDLGHAHLQGSVLDAVEAVSGHLLTVHAHDNAGRRDDHLVPGQGTIPWEATVMALQKVGYDGVLMLEPAAGTDAATVLTRCQDARRRLDALRVTF